MSFFSLFRVEVSRLFQSRMTWLILLLTLLTPLAGYSYYRPTRGDTMSSLYLANPVGVATLAGTLLFAVLTLYELSRVHRNHMEALTDSLVSPIRLHAVRLLAVQTVAFATALAAMLLYLPYTSWKLGIVFAWGDYIVCFMLFLLPGLWFGSLAAAFCYQIVRRFDISILAVLVFLIFSRSGLSKGKFLMQWSFPLVPALSDDFSNALVYRTAFYSRIVWLILLSGGGLLSLLCVRRYGKGLVGSFFRTMQRVWVPCLAVLLLAGGGALWKNQPFMDNTPVKWMEAEPEDHTLEGVYLTNTELDIRMENYLLGALSGTGIYTVENTTGQEQPVYLRMNPGYSIRKIKANGVALSWEDMKNDYIAAREIRCTLPASSYITLTIEYGGVPKTWNAMESTLGGYIISPSYIELKGTHLAPVPEIQLKSEGTQISLQCTMKGSLVPVTSGYTTELLSENSDGSKTWYAHDKGEDTLSLFAGNYVKADLDGAGMPVEFYYSQKYRTQLEKINAIQTMEEAIRYCTEHYGPRAFTEDKPFKILQQTVFVFGGQARANISSMGESSFSAQNLNDSEKGASASEVLAHEIIHQWWGLSAQMIDASDSYWTDEGITVYTTYRLMKALKGEEYANTHYLQKWEKTVSENQNNFYIRHPEYLSVLPEEYAADLKAGLQSVNWYDGTALMIKRAADQAGGEERLDQILSELYKNGGTEMPPYISLNDFLNACGLTKEAVGRD